jgi:hypothetical protein
VRQLDAEYVLVPNKICSDTTFITAFRAGILPRAHPVKGGFAKPPKPKLKKNRFYINNDFMSFT